MGVDLVPPVADVVIGACRERGLLVLTAGDNTLAPRAAADSRDEASPCVEAVEIIDRPSGLVT